MANVMSDPQHNHPLTGARPMAALALLTPLGLGLALMIYDADQGWLFWVGFVISLLGAAATAWLFGKELLAVRVLNADLKVIAIALLIGLEVFVPLGLYLHIRTRSRVWTEATARLRLHYTQPINPEMIEARNVATSHTMAFLADGSSITNPSSNKVIWTDLFIVFDSPITVSHVRIHFEDGATVVSYPIKIEPRFALIKFERELTDKIVDVEFVK